MLISFARFLLLMVAVHLLVACGVVAPRKELEQFKVALEGRLADGTVLQVTSELQLLAKPAIHISLPLLPGQSPDEKNPAVPGWMASNNSASTIANLRCVQLLRAINGVPQTPDAGNIVIELRHGMQMIDPNTSFTINEARTILVVQIPLVRCRGGWSSRSVQEIIESWKVIDNRIDIMHFGPVPSGQAPFNGVSKSKGE